MSTKSKPHWPFYASWIILTGLCVPVAFILYFLIIKIVTGIVGDFIIVDGVRHFTEDYLLGYIFVPTCGLLMGLVQYLLLHRILPGMGWWVPATAVGWITGLILVFSLRELVVRLWSMEAYFTGNWALDVAFVQLGLAVGFFQWLVLRRKLPGAGWWIVANVLGWGLISLAVGETLGQFSVVLLSLLPACTTAVALALLLKQVPTPEPQSD